MQVRDQDSNGNLNMNSMMSFTNHFKTQQELDINNNNSSTKSIQLNAFGLTNNNNDSQSNYKMDRVDEQQGQNGFVFDITHSFAKENFINQGNQNANNNDLGQQYQGITGSSCSSMQQFTHRTSSSNTNQLLYPLKSNINIGNQNLTTYQTNQNNLLNTQYFNTQQSMSGIGSHTKLGFDDVVKSPCKNNVFGLSNNPQNQMQQENINNNNNNSNGVLLPPVSPPSHHKIHSVIVNPITQQQQESKSSLFIPLNQLLSSNTEQSISQNNSSVLCNTNAKSSYRSNSTILNNNSQVINLNVRSILNNNNSSTSNTNNNNINNNINNNSNFDLNSIITNNNFNPNNSSLNINNNHFQITNNNYSNNNTSLIHNANHNNYNNGNFSTIKNSNNSQFINNNNNLNKSTLEENKLNHTTNEITNRSFLGEQQSQNITSNNNNNNNKSMMNGSNNNNNISFVANCNNTTIMKALEKNMDVSQQQVQHLINSSQQLQQNYTLEIERYMEQLNELKDKQERCENKQKKKKKELEEIENMIKQVENKQQYERLMVLSNEESRKQRVELTFNNHQQLDIVLQKIKNLIAVIPDVKMHERFLSSTQPLEGALKQLSESKREVIMHLLRERDEQMKFSEFLSALREDFNSYIMQNTEYTLLYEEYSEVYDSLKVQYPTESEYVQKNVELTNQKEFISQKLQEVKQNHECIQSEIQYKEQKIAKLNENSQFLQTRLEQARKNKQSAPDYQAYENQFQLFLQESFDENAKQFYKDFIRIFDAEFLQSSISKFTGGDTNNLITKVIQFQSLLLQETHLVLQNQTTLNCEDLRRIQDQKRELMIELNQVDTLREIILSILSYDQLLLNVSMCVRNMKRKDIVMQTFYQYLMSKKTQFTFRFQAQNDITSITEEYMRVNKDLLTIEGEKKLLQAQISETLKDISLLKSQYLQICSSLDGNENNFKIHFAKECASYYDQYLIEKNIVIKDISFTYGKAYVEKLEQDIKEEFQKANQMHLERIKEQIFSLNQNMQKVTEKRQRNFRILEDEIKPQYEEYKRKQRDCESKQQCLSVELADVINKERVYIQQLNNILAEQFDLKNKKFAKGSTFSNLQELMQQSEDEALSNYNQTLQLMLKQNTQKQKDQEISIFSQLQLLREKMNVIQEELERMTRNDIEVISQVESSLTKSETVMKEFHSKIEQIHSVLKDQLTKMNVDSDTIFNTFNLNFSNQVLSVKDLINRNQDRMKIIVNLTNNSKPDSKTLNNNSNIMNENTKRSRCSKSMYIDAPKQSQRQTNHNQSQIQYNNNNNNSQIQPKYGKITIDMNDLNLLQDSKPNNNLALQTSLSGSNYQNKENQQPLNFSSKGINWQLPQNKLNQSQKNDDMLSSNSSEAFFNSNAQKSNRLMTSSRSQSQIFMNNNRQNSNGMLTSGRIPSSILNDPLYNELTSTNSIQCNQLFTSGQQHNTYFPSEANKSIQQLPSSSHLTNMSSINSPPSLSASKSNKALFKRANSFNTTSSQQINNNNNNNNSSGNIAQQIHKIANGNNAFKKPLNRNNSNLLFTNWNNQNNNNSNLNNNNNNINNTSNLNNTFRDFSPNNKNVLQNYNLPSAYNNNQMKQLNSKNNNTNNDYDRSDQNITLNLSHINHVHNASSGNNHYTNSTNTISNNNNMNNLIHNNSLLHNISINNNNTNNKNQEQASAFLDISALNMISATNRNDQSGIFTQTLNTNNNNNSKIYYKNSNFLNDNKNSLYDDNSFCLNTNNDRSMLMTENNNQRALNTSQNKRLNSMSSQQMNNSKLTKKQSISSANTQSGNKQYIEIYKMYGVCRDNLIKKQIYDPINNTAKPTSFGYAKRFLRINEKTQNLEIVKEEMINQQPRKTIEQAYSKLLVKNISIPSITSSILEYKNEYRFKEPEDEIVSKFVNCNNLPFSIEIEKMGKIECIALNEEDLLLLMKHFCQ